MGLKKRKLLFDTEYFPHYYLCTYIPKGIGSDKLSQSVVHFKNGLPPHLQAWVECSVEELRTVTELKQSYVIRAFGHNEQKYDSINNPGISWLTAKVCNAVRGTYLPNFLEKTRTIGKLSLLNKREREREVEAAFRFHSPGRNPKHILVIDDVLTSGATMKAIIAAILKEEPSINISIFTLAYTDYHGSNDDVVLESEHYRWIPNDSWMVVAEDSPEYASTLARIKQSIMDDDFT